LIQVYDANDNLVESTAVDDDSEIREIQVRADACQLKLVHDMPTQSRCVSDQLLQDTQPFIALESGFADFGTWSVTSLTVARPATNISVQFRKLQWRVVGTDSQWSALQWQDQQRFTVVDDHLEVVGIAPNSERYLRQSASVVQGGLLFDRQHWQPLAEHVSSPQAGTGDYVIRITMMNAKNESFAAMEGNDTISLSSLSCRVLWGDLEQQALEISGDQIVWESGEVTMRVPVDAFKAPDGAADDAELTLEVSPSPCYRHQ
jgi:hypothetical protein